MSDAKYSAPPWTVERWSDGKSGPKGISIRDAEGGYLANMVGQLADNEMANARLMAAAPALLDIAERTARHFEGTDAPLGIAAREALRAAQTTARSRPSSEVDGIPEHTEAPPRKP